MRKIDNIFNNNIGKEIKMNTMFKTFLVTLAVLGVMSFSLPSAMAKNSDAPRTGEVTLKTVGACALSFLVWPGIGQAVNNDKGEKVATHAILGLTGIYRFWSGYDALVDRHGGYWKGRI